MTSERIQRRIESLLDEADVAADAHDWALVIERAEMVLGVDAGNSDAESLITIARRGLGGDVPPSSAAPTPPSAKAPATPTSFASGRYEVRRFLGEGGKKRVFLAHDSLLDRAEPGQVLVSRVVADLCAGKGFEFTSVGDATLKGFDEPVALFEVKAS